MNRRYRQQMALGRFVRTPATGARNGTQWNRFTKVGGMGQLTIPSDIPFAETITQIITEGQEAGEQIVTGRGKELLTEFIASTEFQQVLDAVEEKAKEGVKEEAAKNAIYLAALAAALGGAGGFAVGFLGKAGLIGALGLGGWAVYSMISKAEEPPKQLPPTPPARRRLR